jgi:hypothetical protein
MDDKFKSMRLTSAAWNCLKNRERLQAMSKPFTFECTTPCQEGSCDKADCKCRELDGTMADDAAKLLTTVHEGCECVVVFCGERFVPTAPVKMRTFTQPITWIEPDSMASRKIRERVAKAVDSAKGKP